jgi:hypothetical protein
VTSTDHLHQLEEKQVSAARSDQQAENEALKKQVHECCSILAGPMVVSRTCVQIKTLNDMLEKQREMVRPIELLVRELYYRKGRRTVFEVLEEQYREDKVCVEDVCVCVYVYAFGCDAEPNAVDRRWSRPASRTRSR